MSSSFANRIELALARVSANEACILVALSGGPDSTALLLALHEIRARNPGLTIVAGHVNHGLRGEESEGDEEFCRQLCRELDVRCLRRKIVCTDRSEETLRARRYEELARMAEEAAASVCVTGHTRDDQVETFFFRFLRGTSPSGLSGIPFQRRLNPRLLLVRPMLELTRDDCLSYLNKRQIAARIDSSNHNLEYSRNFLRQEILPRLSLRFPGFEKRVERLIKQIDGDEAELTRQASIAFDQMNGMLELELLANQAQALKSRIIVRALADKNIEVSWRRVEAILEMAEEPFDAEERISLNGRWDLHTNNGCLEFLDKISQSEPVELEQPVSIPGTTLIAALNMALKVEIAPSRSLQVFPDKTEWTIFADLSAASGQPTLRLRQPGDRISPLGMDSAVRLKKYLHTHKSNSLVKLNNTVVVLADDSEVLWIPGLAISRKIAVKGQPSHKISLVQLSVDPQSFC